MANNNILSDIEQCIIQYEYPLANSMSDKELGDIFKASNRCFLVSWILKLINQHVNSENEKNIDVLGQLLYEYGFCTKEEKLPFMTGALGISEQVQVFHRIFTFIKILKKPVTNVMQKPVSFEDMENLSKDNMNLFPMFGEIKISQENKLFKKSDTEYQNKYLKKNDFASINNKISEQTEYIYQDLLKLKNAVENYRDPEYVGENENSILTHSDTTKEFGQCKENIKIISQFFKDCHTIEEFTKYTEDSLQNSSETSTIDGDLLKGICEEISSIQRLQKMN